MSTSTRQGRYPRRSTRSPQATPAPGNARQPRDAAMPPTALNVPQTFGAPIYHEAETNVGREEGTAQIAQLMAPTTTLATARDANSHLLGRSPSPEVSAPRTRATSRRDNSVETPSVAQNTRSRRNASAKPETRAQGGPSGTSRAPSGPPSRASSRAASVVSSIANASPSKRTTRSQAARTAAQGHQSLLGTVPEQADISASFGNESGEYYTSAVGPNGERIWVPTTNPATPIPASRASTPPARSSQRSPSLPQSSDGSDIASQISHAASHVSSSSSESIAADFDDLEEPASESEYSAEQQIENEFNDYQNNLQANHAQHHRRDWSQVFEAVRAPMGVAIQGLWGLVLVLCVLTLAATLYKAIMPHYRLDRTAWDRQVASWDNVPQVGKDGYRSSWAWPSWSDLQTTLTNPQDILSDLVNRLTNVEDEVASLKTPFRLHASSIQKLEEILPENLAVKPAWDGKGRIDPDFWIGLKQKIEDDYDVLRLTMGTKDTEGAQDVARELAKTQWLQFLGTNSARVEGARQDSGDGDEVVTRDEFINFVLMSAEVNRDAVESAAQRLNEQYDRTAARLDVRASSVASEVAAFAANSRMKAAIPANELSALAQANLMAGTEAAIRKVNYFSPGLGAAVDPHLTSPAYTSSHKDSRRGVAAFMNLGVRRPNPPVAALEPWSDVGDCWCTPSDSGMAQIAVLLPRSIYPTEITIDHIPRTSTLDIVSAPREVEVFAQFSDESVRRAVWGQALSRLGPERLNENETLDETWVRVGLLRYDVFSLSNVQSLPLQVDLEGLGAKVDKLVVRARENWGHPDHTCFYRVRAHGVLVHPERTAMLG